MTYSLRTLTYNVLIFMGWSREGTCGLGRSELLRRAAEELSRHEPDVITFQESPGEADVATIAEHLGMNHTFFYSGQSWNGSLLTRYEILETKNCPVIGGQRPEKLFTRHWGRAVLRAPFGELVVHSAHLRPGISEVRMAEAEQMLEVLRVDMASGRPLLLQGDLNHTPDGPEYALWRSSGLLDAFAMAGVGPGETIPADDPVARIDYVWAYGSLVERLREARVLNERPFRTDPSDPESWSLSDHLPVLAVFE